MAAAAQEEEDLQEQFLQLQHEKALILKRQHELESIWQDAEAETAHQQSLIADLEKRLREHEQLAEQRAQERVLAAQLEQELEEAQDELRRTKQHLTDTRSELTDMKSTLAGKEGEAWNLYEAMEAEAERKSRMRELELLRQQQLETERLLQSREADVSATSIDPQILDEQQEEIRRLRDRLDEETERARQLQTELQRRENQNASALSDELSLASELAPVVVEFDNERLAELEQQLNEAREREERERLAREEAELKARQAAEQVDSERLARELAEARAAEAAAHAETEIARAAAEAARDAKERAEREAAERQAALQRERESLIARLSAEFPMFERAVIREVLIDSEWHYEAAEVELSKRKEEFLEQQRMDALLEQARRDALYAKRLQDKEQETPQAQAQPAPAATEQTLSVKPKKKLTRKISAAEMRRQELIRKKQEAQEEEQRRLADEERRKREAQRREQQRQRANAHQADVERRRAQLLEEQRALQAEEALPGMVLVQCPVCDTAIHAFPGQKVACPSCETVLNVPGLASKQETDFAITLPSQDKIFQVRVLPSEDASTLGLGGNFSMNCVLKFTTNAVALLAMNAHRPVMEWPISRIKTCSANKRVFELIAWVEKIHRLASIQFHADKSNEMLKVVRKIINDYTARKDAFIARDMQKEELIDVVDLTEEFLAELRMDEEFNRILARETRTGFEELQQLDDAKFGQLLTQMGKDSRRILKGVRKRSKATARKLGLGREPRLRAAIAPVGAEPAAMPSTVPAEVAATASATPQPPQAFTTQAQAVQPPTHFLDFEEL